MSTTSPTSRGFRHELISASAGSGKTYQLVRRYLHLLALGVDPTSIVAMTFTRKAAGEFFNRILTKLARLASGQDSARDYFKGAQPAVPADVDYAKLLRRLTRCSNRLRLGTLDSFFGAIANCFPFENGLPATSTVMDEEEAKRAQMEALDSLLDQLQRNTNDATTGLILQAIKQAGFGSESKSIEGLLRDWVGKNHLLWKESSGNGWGDPARIWPDWTDSLPGTSELQQLAIALRERFPNTTPSGAKALDSLVDAVLETTPGMKPPSAVAAFLEKTAAHLDELASGSAVISWGRRPSEISGDLARLWLNLATGLSRRDFFVRATRTRALADFIAAFEAVYHQHTRAAGRLSFADIPLLLSEAAQTNHLWPDEDIWFRLDGRFHHWMLDEFQDTSHSQWRVTRKLVAEVLQDADGQRSFFAVGDVKQSIYLWRQAEPKIFAQLGGQPNVQPGTLSTSYRSGPQVLAAVNRVFADRAAIEHLLPGSTENWQFEPHTSSQPEMAGYAALLQISSEEETSEAGGAADEPADFSAEMRLTAALIRRLNPLARNLTCAVLVRSNDKASDYTEALRALTGMPVVTESKIQPAIDNVVTLALLSLLQLAAHPDDSAALEHLRMSPLRPLLETAERQIVTSALRTGEAVFEHGFASFAQEWTQRLREFMPGLDAFHHRRLNEFAGFCASFDETGSRDIDLFLQQAREHSLARPASAEAIQVMTIHKSKGLEFDIVIPAGLGKDSMDKRRGSEWLVEQEDGQTNWVLQNPLKVYAETDSVLRGHQRRVRAVTAFESLCLLYVAMTRAKRALYLITPPPPKKPGALNPAAFLRSQLGTEEMDRLELDHESAGILWQEGGSDWFEQFGERAPAAPPPAEPSPLLAELLRENQPRQRRRTPSGEEDFTLPGHVLLSPQRDLGRQLGSRVHELLAEVEWWTAGAPLEPLHARWNARGLIQENDDAVKLALDLVLPALNDPALAAAFVQPVAGARLWREKAFDFIDEGGWVSGVFDRVILDIAADGTVTHARLIDFKTDEIGDEAVLEKKCQGYAPQLALYRRAVARLARLPVGQIDCHLLFLRARRLVQV